MIPRFAVLALPLLAACSSAGPSTEAVGASSSALAVTGTAIANLALANVGGMACGTNSLGGHAFESSCTGNGGQPEYWCADFAIWVWANAGVSDIGGLTAAAGSFYTYGQNHGTLKNTPAVGDAAVFGYTGGGVAGHVAIVTKVNTDGTIETASGDWNGQSGSEAYFSSTSHVVLNTPAYAPTVGSTPSVMGQTLSGFISPVGLSASLSYGASFVAQSFPLASSALTMKAGESLPAYIELRNSGTKTWDGKTRLGTTQPRDRTSAFADGSWLAPNRPAGVTGTVAPGSTYKFEFTLHAPDKPGTYFEYFGVLEEGVNWFSDPGQGGPPDNDLEVQIVVEAAPDAGSAHDAGATHGDAGATEDAGAAPTDDAGSGATGTPASGDDAGGVALEAGAEDDAGGGALGAQGGRGGGGCAAARGGAGLGGAAWLLGAALAFAASRRRRR